MKYETQSLSLGDDRAPVVLPERLDAKRFGAQFLPHVARPRHARQRAVIAVLILAVAFLITSCGQLRMPSHVTTVPSRGLPSTTGTSPYGSARVCPAGNSQVTPEQFGAIGNNAADDTNALQRAIDAAAAKHVVVSLDCRTYRVDAMLNIPGGVTLTGFGNRSILHFTWFDQVGPNSHGGAYLQAYDTSNITLTSFSIEGDSDGEPTGPSRWHPRGMCSGIRIMHVDGFTVSHVNVRKTPAIGINYQDSSNGTITDNYVHNTGRDGITGFYDNSVAHAHVTVAHNRIADVGDDGIAVNGSVSTSTAPVAIHPEDFTIIDNSIDGWPVDPNGLQMGRGIEISGAVNVLVKFNTINRTVSDGILIMSDLYSLKHPNAVRTYSSGVQVLDNNILNAGQDEGVDFGGTRDPRAGLQVVGADRLTIAGNKIMHPYGPDRVVG